MNARTLDTCPRCKEPAPPYEDGGAADGLAIDCTSCGASLESLWIGRIGTVRTTGTVDFRPRVRIAGTRRAYGRADLLVEPTDGTGSQWIAAFRLMMDPEATP